MGAVKVGIVGDFSRGKHSHWATEAALFHAAAQLGIRVEPRWVPTPVLAAQRAATVLEPFDAIWGAPGSPYRSMAGVLRAIEYARTRNVPYLGTCAGFQYALIEFSRNVLGLADADSAENESESQNIVITPVVCDIPSNMLTRLNGDMLRRVAAVGAGQFVTLDALPGLIRTLHADASRTLAAGQAAPQLRVASWRNDGIWLLPALLLLAALLARRGWL